MKIRFTAIFVHFAIFTEMKKYVSFTHKLWYSEHHDCTKKLKLSRSLEHPDKIHCNLSIFYLYNLFFIPEDQNWTQSFQNFGSFWKSDKDVLEGGPRCCLSDCVQLVENMLVPLFRRGKKLLRRILAASTFVCNKSFLFWSYSTLGTHAGEAKLPFLFYHQTKSLFTFWVCFTFWKSRNIENPLKHCHTISGFKIPNAVIYRPINEFRCCLCDSSCFSPLC